MRRILIALSVVGFTCLPMIAGDLTAIRRAVNQWKIKSVTAKGSHVFIDTYDKMVTAEQYSVMLTAICFLADEKKQALAGFRQVSIRNFSGRYGFTYESLASCTDVLNAKADKANITILSKTHTLFDSERKPLP